MSYYIYDPETEAYLKRYENGYVYMAEDMTEATVFDHSDVANCVLFKLQMALGELNKDWIIKHFTVCEL